MSIPRLTEASFGGLPPELKILIAAEAAGLEAYVDTSDWRVISASAEQLSRVSRAWNRAVKVKRNFHDPKLQSSTTIYIVDSPHSLFGTTDDRILISLRNPRSWNAELASDELQLMASSGKKTLESVDKLVFPVFKAEYGSYPHSASNYSTACVHILSRLATDSSFCPNANAVFFPGFPAGYRPKSHSMTSALYSSEVPDYLEDLSRARPGLTIFADPCFDKATLGLPSNVVSIPFEKPDSATRA